MTFNIHVHTCHLSKRVRKGINPFTKEPTLFKAKPARKIVRARPVKAAKAAV